MILYRYIAKGIPRPFIYSLLVIVLIFVMMLAVRLLPRIMHRGIPVEIILQLFSLRMVGYLALAVPLALLVSTLMVFGRLSGDNEFTAVKAGGIGLKDLLPPVIAISAVIAVALIYFNSYLLPEANVRSQQIYRDIMKTKPMALIQPGVLQRDFPGYALLVDSVNHSSGKLYGLTIFADEKDQTPSVTVADSGTLYLTEDEQEVELRLYDGVSVSDGARSGEKNLYEISFGEQVIFFDNPSQSFDNGDAKLKARNDREMTITQLRDDRQQLLKQREDQYKLHADRVADLGLFLDSLEQRSTSLVKKNATTKSPRDTIASFVGWSKELGIKSSRRGARDYIRREHHTALVVSNRIERSETKADGNLVEIYKKYALAVSAIIFAVLGVALGIVGRSGSITVSILYAVLAYIINYAFLIGGETLANRDVVSPAVAMWSGNLVLALLAAYLIARTSRDGGMFNLKLVYLYTIRPLLTPFIWLRNRFKNHTVRGRKKSLLEPLLSLPRKVTHLFIPTLEAYIFGRFITYFVVMLGSLVVLFSVLDYVGNLAQFEGALLPELMRYYTSFTITFLPMIVPITILLAVMMTFGSFSKTQEITAIKAAGIHIIKVTLPFLFFGCIIAGVNFWFNEKMVSEAMRQMDLLEDVFSARRNDRPIPTAIKTYRRDFYYFNGEETAYRFGHLQTEPARADQVLQYRFKDRELVAIVEAESMTYDSVWTLLDGEERTWKGGKIHVTPFKKRVESHLTLSPAEMVRDIKLVDQMSYGELRHAVEVAKLRGESINKYQADLSFKFALPLMNIVVILIGVAVTARAGKRGGSVNFGMGILLIFAYWGVAQFLLLFGRGGTLHPQVAAWGGTVFFMLLGSWMYLRSAR